MDHWMDSTAAPPREQERARDIAHLGSVRNTVAKWLHGELVEPKYRRSGRPNKLAPYCEALQQALAADARRPKHERRTAKALYAQLQAQGYQAGYTRVTDFVRRGGIGAGAAATNAFVPLAFELGEAYQFDWSEALRTNSGIALDYDAERTRNAAEAFEVRRGNCLALVVMTAALADELRLPVRFNLALLPELWSRNGDLYVRSGHVNLTIEPATADGGPGRPGGITIDFMPPEDARRMPTRTIGRETVRAMFMNNRAVESLAAGRIDEAYAWAAAALRGEPSHGAAANTLGVIYLRHGDLVLAERALRYALDREPGDLLALGNLALVLERAGRDADAAAVRQQLARLEPHPPFHYFDLGRSAMARGEFRRARELFEKEAARDPDYHEFQFALAQASFQMGDEAAARRHLERAARSSPSGSERQLYEAKLTRLREVH